MKNNRIRVNGVLYEAVDGTDGYKPAYKIPAPSVDGNWDVDTDYDSRSKPTVYSNFDCIYKDLPIEIKFQLTSWHYLPNDPDLSEYYSKPWIQMWLTVGQYFGRTDLRTVDDDSQGEKSSQVVSDILNDIENDLDNIIRVASNPEYTLFIGSDSDKIFDKTIESSMESIIDTFDGYTVKR